MALFIYDFIRESEFVAACDNKIAISVVEYLRSRRMPLQYLKKDECMRSNSKVNLPDLLVLAVAIRFRSRTWTSKMT